MTFVRQDDWDRIVETIEIVDGLWRGTLSTYQGRYYQVTDAGRRAAIDGRPCSTPGRRSTPAGPRPVNNRTHRRRGILSSDGFALGFHRGLARSRWALPRVRFPRVHLPGAGTARNGGIRARRRDRDASLPFEKA